MKKKWYQSKNIQIAIIQAIIGLVVAIEAANPEMKAIGTVAIVKASLDAALRIISVTELEQGLTKLFFQLILSVQLIEKLNIKFRQE